MEKYSVQRQVGKGSYGTVYKAITKKSNEIVALKIITKREKTQKEVQSIRQEFEIQRTMCHPNIIHMLDSFETDSDIIVVTEFAPQDLSQILKCERQLQEERVKSIVCDLLSALYYLHYHRVLHRDLKPQNILMDAKGTAKLCDFGFARSMSIDTYVLTSFKGTPLYMAPEIFEQCPYDHSADLWSLGCIVYECLVGTPPYYTNALLRFVNLIQKDIEWPSTVSPECLSFLQGLLQKDPSQRLSWPNLLSHSFVDSSKIKLENIPSNASVAIPLTHPLTASQALAREKQKKDLICHVAGKPRNYIESAKYLEQQEYKRKVLQELQSHPKTRVCLAAEQHGLKDQHLPPPKNRLNVPPIVNGNDPQNVKILQSEQANQTDPSAYQIINKSKISNILSEENNENVINGEDSKFENLENKTEDLMKNIERESSPQANNSKSGDESLSSWIPEANAQPIECEEWLVFLQKTMEEVMEGEVDVMTQQNFVAMLVAPLHNPLASSKVIEYVANLLSLPFVVNGVTDLVLTQIKQVYSDVRAVPKLVYASHLLAQQRSYDNDSEADESLRPVSDLGADELHAIECIYLLLCNLTHMSDDFLVQFCDVVVFKDGIPLLKQLLHLGRRKPRIVADLLAILAHILRALPENAELVEKIALDSTQGGKTVDLNHILKNKCPLLRSRCCHLLRQLGLWSCRALQCAWTTQLRVDLENLCSDSNDAVRKAAEKAVSELKGLVFYEAQSRPKR